MEVTTVSSIMNYAINGFINHSYAIYLGLIAIITTGVGLLVLNYILEHFKRTSFISFLMGSFFVIAILIVIKRMVHIVLTEDHIFRFLDYCSPDSYTRKIAH